MPYIVNTPKGAYKPSSKYNDLYSPRGDVFCLHQEELCSMFHKTNCVLYLPGRVCSIFTKKISVPYSPRTFVFCVHQEELCSMFTTKNSCFLPSPRRALFYVHQEKLCSLFTKKSCVLCSPRRIIWFSHPDVFTDNRHPLS